MKSISFKAGGGLIDEDAIIYIERPAEQEALAHLRSMNYVLVIEPRQQGKTSLINHLMRHPVLNDMNLVYVDVTTLDRSTEESWYQSLCPRILRQLRDFIPRDEEVIIPHHNTGWRQFLSEIALRAAEAHRRFVIALDEIGAVTFPGTTEFFSVLRDIYNSRQAEDEFKQLTFWLVGAFHPRDLIEDDKISPFNIAQRVRLPDFTLAQVSELVSKGPWSNEQAATLAQRIHYWTDGQPYLTQLLCSYLETKAGPTEVDISIERLRCEDENHLPPLLERLSSDKKLWEYVSKIQSGERIKFYPRENRRQAQLELLGVLKADADGYCTVRNQIYQQSLRGEIIKSVDPIEETEQPKRLTPHTATIRQLLTDAFDDEDLSALCYDYFRAAYKRFSSGMGLADKIQRLLEHCDRHNELDALLKLVEDRNPAQYRRYAESRTTSKQKDSPSQII